MYFCFGIIVPIGVNAWLIELYFTGNCYLVA